VPKGKKMMPKGTKPVEVEGEEKGDGVRSRQQAVSSVEGRVEVEEE